MNKILKELCKRANNEKICEYKIGNYKVYKDDILISHYYYGSCICSVDLKNKIFILSACGYTNYRLTTAQLNYLEHYYKQKGFELICRR